MATKYSRGGGASVAQVDRFTPANVEVSDVFTLTATGEDGSTKAVSFTATAATVANVTAGLAAAWNASTDPLATPLTAADATTSLTLTADTAGVPFSVASTTTDGGGANTQTLTRSVVTANSGPEDAGTATNYSDSTALANTGDSLYLDGRAANSIKYGLNLSGKTLDLLDHYQSFTKDFGTVNAPVRVSATLLNIGRPTSDGSRTTPGGFYITTGTNATTATVYSGKSTGTSGVPGVCIKGAHASNVLYIRGGIVGVATQLPGDTANFPIITVEGNQTVATLGSGLSTITTMTIDEATVTLRAAATTINQTGGSVTTEGSAAIATYNCRGKLIHNSTGTVTTLNLTDAADADLTQTELTRTVTTINLRGKQAKLRISLKTTVTNGINLYDGALSSQVTYETGTNLAATAAP